MNIFVMTVSATTTFFFVAMLCRGAAAAAAVVVVVVVVAVVAEASACDGVKAAAGAGKNTSMVHLLFDPTSCWSGASGVPRS